MRKEKYHRTKGGVVSKIYSHQKQASFMRGYLYPSYTREELKDWLFSQEKFHKLFKNWKISGFKRDLVPSCDRIDDYKSYTFNNIELKTWKENRDKLYIEKINGINNKQARSILQFTKDGIFIKEHYSLMSASRELNINHGNISKVCNKQGYNKSAGGYIWKYKNQEDLP